jgi:hypothetical protein
MRPDLTFLTYWNAGWIEPRLPVGPKSSDTKLVPAYRVGNRTREHAVAFMTDLSERLSNRFQIS